MRLEKPIGTWLLAWPCFWSIALAAPPGTPPDLRMLALFGAGSLLLRGAGCTVNDLWDRKLDKQVERTRTRPLAAGTVTPAQAVAFLGVQLSTGLAILLQLNPYAQALGASSLALVAAYPAMKRITSWPQAFLGLTFNWGALFGWAAVHGSCDWGVVLPMYASGVCWTLVYDTIYAHQDKADDVRVGIRSTALTFGDRTKHYCAAFAAANAALLCAAGAAAGAGPAYYAGLAGAASHLAWQISTVDLDDPQDCAAKFASNTWYGALLFAGILADRVALLSGAAYVH
ncbi:4-hydroxybenzoate polyprenyl transferase [Micractinium conductrix]|uniref:4-hydroxybenzoate polyprenyltransferase, mitochondrial n=1 Tax=Micractinium conductrix TaxID=554055 RepID=A0A2P6VP46_9CHLO|nr:4-hydroxybenzoate polyprenyl transferase [Micractinium conductrix]|eukprot:PSC75871.1 4-hydroxybenzoate polyprenyl transferase [Micractinium conductrix]